MGQPHQDIDAVRRRLVAGLRDRREVADDGERLAELDASLAADLTALYAAARPPRMATTSVPPQRVGVAMALAIYGQPYLGALLVDGPAAGTESIEEEAPTAPDPPFTPAKDQLESGLGLAQWELDDLRAEIDRRVGDTLLQSRALNWMWTRFGLPDASPEPLFRLLVPGAPSRIGQVSLVRRGAQLYAVVDRGAPPHANAMHVSRGESAELPGVPPEATFRGSDVDAGLRRGLAKAIGCDDSEVVRTLHRMVVVIPRGQASSLLASDRWRSRGFATLSDLGRPYPDATALSRPMRPDDVDWRSWISVEGGQLQLTGQPVSIFDSLAVTQVTRMMRELYAAMLSRVYLGGPIDPTDIALLDAGAHVQRVCGALLAWVGSAQTQAQIAAELQVDPDALAAKLGEVRAAWQQRLSDPWLAHATEERESIEAIVVQHLIAVQGSLRRLAQRAPDRETAHRDLLILFAANYLAEGRLERLWLHELSDTAVELGQPLPPEDIVGDWFWGTWQHFLGELDTEAITGRF